MLRRGTEVTIETRGRRPLIGALLALLAVACSPLKTFDTLVPKDSGVAKVADDVAFGADPRQRLDLYAPIGARAAPLPVIVFFYGGSWNSGIKDGYAFVGRALAARGFLVAIPDYRLLPQIAYPSFLEDNAAAVRWVVGHAGRYGGDPRRLLLAGHSAGAYDAAMLAFDPRWLGADRDRIRGLIGLAGPYDFLPLDSGIATTTFGGVADAASTQPVNFVRAGDPPAFLATGDKDGTVRPSNSDSLERRLRAAGVAVERKRYPDIGHVGLVTAIARPFRGRAAVLDDLTAFAKQVSR